MSTLSWSGPAKAVLGSGFVSSQPSSPKCSTCPGAGPTPATGQPVGALGFIGPPSPATAPAGVVDINVGTGLTTGAVLAGAFFFWWFFLRKP